MCVASRAGCRVPQVGVLADLCCCDERHAQVPEYRDLWYPAAASCACSILEKTGGASTLPGRTTSCSVAPPADERRSKSFGSIIHSQSRRGAGSGNLAKRNMRMGRQSRHRQDPHPRPPRHHPRAARARSRAVDVSVCRSRFPFDERRGECGQGDHCVKMAAPPDIPPRKGTPPPLATATGASPRRRADVVSPSGFPLR